MSVEAPTQPTSGWYVVCQIGDQFYSIHSEWASELVRSRDTKIVAVPGTHPAIAGMLNHRGTVLPVIDLRQILGLPSFSDEIDAMKSMIKTRENDHIVWIEELLECVEKGTRFTKALDPTKCAFGQWYEELRNNETIRRSVTKGSNILDNYIGAFDAPHRKIHGIASAVLQLSGEGKIAEARAIVEETRDHELAAMRRLFTDFIAAFEATRIPSVVAMNVHNIPFALFVDEVKSVIELEATDFGPAPEVATQEQALVRHSVQRNGDLVLNLDAEELVQLIIPDIAA